VNDLLTRDQVEKALPATLKSAATQELTDVLNNLLVEPEVAEQIRSNFIGYAHVLKDGKFKTEDYLHAIAYVSFKVMGLTNREAYERTFPDRMQALVARGESSKNIAAYVTAYSKGKLVNLILEQTLVPTWVLNQDLYQKAINVQAELMLTAGSEKVRTEAANSLLTHLKKPEVKEFQISVESKENSGMRELKDALLEMARKQQELIAGGTATREIAAIPLIEGEYVEVESALIEPDKTDP
jgi:hypothetical protein